MDLTPLSFLIYIIPGYIFVNIKSLSVPTNHERDLGYLTEILAGSLCSVASSYAITAIVARFVKLNYSLPRDPLNVSFDESIWVLFILSTILAIPLSLIWSKWLISNTRQKIIATVIGTRIGPYKHVWPQFIKDAQGKWVKITLNDGTCYGGWISQYCLDGTWQDIVISDGVIFEQDCSTVLRRAKNNIYMKLSEVVSIEILEP